MTYMKTNLSLSSHDRKLKKLITQKKKTRCYELVKINQQIFKNKNPADAIIKQEKQLNSFQKERIALRFSINQMVQVFLVFGVKSLHG